jgi:hypothetical protein
VYGSLPSGSTASFTNTISTTSVGVGQTTSGSIWAAYTVGTGTLTSAGATVSAGTTIYYVQIATLTAKSV